MFTMVLLLVLAIIVNDEKEGRWKYSMPFSFFWYLVVTVRWGNVYWWVKMRLCGKSLKGGGEGDLELAGEIGRSTSDGLEDEVRTGSGRE